MRLDFPVLFSPIAQEIVSETDMSMLLSDLKFLMTILLSCKTDAPFLFREVVCFHFTTIFEKEGA